MFARSDFGLSTPGQFFAPLSGSSTPWIEQDLSEADTSDPTKTLKKWSSLIGIVTAIVGNVLIALALNVQRYAHIQLHRRRAQVRERARQAVQRATKAGPDGGQNGTKNGGYGTVRADGNGLERRVSGGSARSDASGLHGDHFEARDTNPLIQRYDERREEEEGEGGAGGVGDDHDDHDDGKNKAVSTYLKSPYWWLGQVLITVGEMGNFLAYGFAPASIVSPLGVVALISNSVIAPFLFNETFRKRDFWGVVVAAAGAVTVVLSAKQQETKLGPHDVWDAITTTEFEVYVAITLALIAVLMWASPRYGNRTILIDLGLVGLFGGYTVLATKGVSSMLSSTLFRAFTTPVAYALLLVLLGTAVLQVRYVNKALQRFDSTQVIPIQFVLFTLSVIIGSAILYRDFERTTAEQAIKFIGGCFFTFFGVFLITSGRGKTDEEEEDELSDEEGVEETIGLAEQGPLPHTPQPGSRRGSEAARRSRRSSRASHVSFLEAVNKPLTVLADTGVPSLRAPAAPGSGSASAPRTALAVDGLAGSPTLGADDVWREREPATPGTPLPRPGLASQAVSTESFPVVYRPSQAMETLAGQATSTSPGTMPLFVESPATPRPSIAPSSPRPHSHHCSTLMYSPSPLSSTVSAVVADTLLRRGDSPAARRLSVRRSRLGLRNSLFVPQDELEDGLLAVHGLGSAGERSQSHEALASPGEEGEEDGLLGAEGSKRSFRTRARSLSNAIGDMFGRKKRRPGASADTDGDEEEEIGGEHAARPVASAVRPSVAAQRSTRSLETP